MNLPAGFREGAGGGSTEAEKAPRFPCWGCARAEAGEFCRKPCPVTLCLTLHSMLHCWIVLYQLFACIVCMLYCRRCRTTRAAQGASKASALRGEIGGSAPASHSETILAPPGASSAPSHCEQPLSTLLKCQLPASESSSYRVPSNPPEPSSSQQISE